METSGVKPIGWEVERKMRKPFLGIAGAAVVAMGAVTACGQAQSAPSNQANVGSASAAPIHLTLGMWASSPAEKQLVERQIALFEKENPNIKVSIQVITGNYLQALQPMLAAHDAPDIFYVDSSYAPTLEASGAIMPLDSFIKQDHVDLSDFQKNLLDAFTWQGHIYGLPKDMNTMALEYNPALLAKAGIQSPPKTFAQFDQDAAKLKAKGIVPLDMPIDVARYYPFIVDMGGSYYNKATNQATFTNKANVAGLTWFMKEMESGNFVTPQDQGGSWAGVPFAEGKAAMALEGAWIVPFMQQTAPKMKYGIADFPSLNGHDANMLFTVAYEMSKYAKNPDAAAKLLFFMTGKEALKMTADSGLAIPSRTSEQGEFLKKYPSYKGFVDGLKGAIPYQFGTLGQNFLDAINNATQQGILKKESAQQVLSQAQQTLASQMND